MDKLNINYVKHLKVIHQKKGDIHRKPNELNSMEKKGFNIYKSDITRRIPISGQTWHGRKTMDISRHLFSTYQESFVHQPPAVQGTQQIGMSHT